MIFNIKARQKDDNIVKINNAYCVACLMVHLFLYAFKKYIIRKAKKIIIHNSTNLFINCDSKFIHNSLFIV